MSNWFAVGNAVQNTELLCADMKSVWRHRIGKLLLLMLLGVAGQWCRAGSSVVVAPTLGQPGADSASLVPFLIQAPRTMRYQQVYQASLFTDLNPDLVYVTALFVFLDSPFGGTEIWTVTNMQINLSTTQMPVDRLSTNFAENVGFDDTVVVGPGLKVFDNGTHAGFRLLLDRPFPFKASAGNLLMDVRIFTGTSPFIFQPAVYPLDAKNSPTDEISVVYADDVTAANASTVSTMGLDTGILMSGIPSLLISKTTFTTPPNYFLIEWPIEWSAFVLERTTHLGSNAKWQSVTNAKPPRYVLPVDSAGPATFYRLIWKSGQPLAPTGLLGAPAKNGELIHTK